MIITAAVSNVMWMGCMIYTSGVRTVRLVLAYFPIVVSGEGELRFWMQKEKI